LPIFGQYDAYLPCLLLKKDTKNGKTRVAVIAFPKKIGSYTLSEAWSGVNRADLMAAQCPGRLRGRFL